MKRFWFVLLVWGISGNIALGQDAKAYQIYNKRGKAISFSKMVAQLANYDIILFGETHNNAIIHWLELRTTKAMYAAKGAKLILGAEMMERDNASAVRQYLKDSIDGKQLGERARLWDNFGTDYFPLLHFAKEHQLPFIATNVPRRYAALVARYGMDTLSTLPQEDLANIATLPIIVDLATPGYREMEDMMSGHAGAKIMNFISAQAIKDATMAESIYKNWRSGQLFLHFNGDYHSKEYGGIYWYLRRMEQGADLRIAVISIAEVDGDRLLLPKDFKRTDFSIVVPEDMAKSY